MGGVPKGYISARRADRHPEGVSLKAIFRPEKFWWRGVPKRYISARRADRHPGVSLKAIFRSEGQNPEGVSLKGIFWPEGVPKGNCSVRRADDTPKTQPEGVSGVP